MTLLQTKDLVKTYKMGETQVVALNKVNLAIERGELVAITGASGSGKSTLMHLLGFLDLPTSGDILLEEKSIVNMTKNELAHIRNQKIGFVFQKFHLLANLTATDNVALPQLYGNVAEAKAREQAKKILNLVGLSDRTKHYPYQLSGGQQQRVAIARALANNPSIILADEPTGNLDTETGNNIIDLFKNLNTQKNVTIIIVTHEPEIAAKTNRIIELIDGKVVSDKSIKKRWSLL